MIEIPLTQGQVALIDDEDWDLVSEFKWFAQKDKKTYYARRANRPKVLLHRFILQAKVGQKVDHIKGNWLDNRRENLRIATSSQNQWNQQAYSQRGSSKFKGVSLYRPYSKWLACIRVNNKRIHLGYFKDEKEAALAYNEAALEYFGEFARLNEVE